MASNSDIWAKVRDSVDIVDVIGEYLRLQRAGKEYKCLCPFHDDHKPSMAVVPQKQIFHCFVCGTGGDVFKFVENYLKMGKGEALRHLAQKGGVVLPELPGDGASRGAGEKSARELIIETNEKACGFFEKTLRAEGGKAGLEYLLKRGLTEETLKLFRLGYSPEGWTGLVTAAGRLGMRNEDLDAAGLVKKRGDGTQYDVFRGRVMFPIFDATGRVIAFGGRILVEKRDEAGNVVEAKYLNSPETRVFEKSQSLYGLNFAKRAIIESQTVIVVEGYMDVIACYQAGVTNVVATLGTALTPEHAKILRRFCNTVVLVFDSDDAGYRAADRAMETFVREPLDVKIASVPEGKDPCDFCMTHGGDEFKKVVAAGKDALTFQWERLQKQFRGTESLSARQTATQQFMRFVGQAMQGAGGQGMDAIRKGLIVSKLAGLLGMSPGEVMAELKKLGESGGGSASRVVGPVAEAVPALLPGEPLGGMTMAEAWVLGALLTRPGLYEGVREEMNLDLFLKFRPLGMRVVEYLENATELEGCSLAGFCAMMNDAGAGGESDEREMIAQAIRVQGAVEAGGKAEENLRDGWKWLWEFEVAAATLDVAAATSEGGAIDEGVNTTVNAARAMAQRGEVKRVRLSK